MNGETFILAKDYQRDKPLALMEGRQIERVWFEPHRDAIEPPSGVTGFGMAYAITTHKGQGSGWPRVLIVDEYPPDKHRDRWIYTAITRASAAVRIRPSRR